jgi:hypothetical protein
MTHSLHRIGTESSLENDYIVLITPSVNINNQGAAAKLKEILNFVQELGPTNIGGYNVGNIYSGADFEDIKLEFDNVPVPRLRCCFSELEKVRRLVNFVVEKEYGLSVTISGLVKQIKIMCKDLGITPHSVNISLGIFGRTDLLPDKHILEIVTMCGHGMISSKLVTSLMSQVASEKISAREAAIELSKPCVCGIFNTNRAEELLTAYVRSSKLDTNIVE